MVLMQKIISLFKRDYEGTRLIYNEVVPGAEWVIAGEGRATCKWDGTCCRVTARRGSFVIWKRYDAKKGRQPPAGWEAAQDPDPTTGHWPGWVPCNRSDPADRWHFEAYDAGPAPQEGTYELVGPKIGNKGGGNPYRMTEHHLIPHGIDFLDDAPRDFEGLKAYFEANPAYEGIVWWRDPHDPDCEKVKVKRRDFGLPWPVRG